MSTGIVTIASRMLDPVIIVALAALLGEATLWLARRCPETASTLSFMTDVFLIPLSLLEILSRHYVTGALVTAGTAYLWWRKWQRRHQQASSR